MASIQTSIRWMMLAAALYGIFLFVWRIATGHFIEIPYLTVNVDDIGQLESKHIDRGGIFKLISTYNNGNVYGVATLILLPLFDHLERSRWRKAIIRFALVLTLSRTVWIGLVLNQLLSLARTVRKDFANFPRIQLKRLGGNLSVTLCSGALIIGGLLVLSQGISFIFDPSLGGRADQLDIFRRATVLPSIPVTGFTEVVYASAVSTFGWSGGVAIFFILLSPALIFLFHKDARRGEARLAALQGTLIYVVLAGMDGAINLIPVMAFYWMAFSMFLHTEWFSTTRLSSQTPSNRIEACVG